MTKPEPLLNPQGIHTECGPLNAAGQPLHLHIWPMNADHTKRWRPVEYVGRHRAGTTDQQHLRNVGVKP